MSSSSSVAAHYAFNISEILEEILLHLEYADILRSKYVSKRFKATIDRFLALQRALWRAPLMDVEKIQVDSKADRCKHPRPPLERHP